MKDFINRLPIDIIFKIIPYTYNLQNKTLLDDITNYTKTKTVLFNFYYKYWIIKIQSQVLNEDKNWLINDIFSYANDYNATMFGYVQKFYDIFKRSFNLQTNEEIYKYVNNLEKKEIVTQINIFLGLFTIEERKDFIQLSCRTLSYDED
jgi:hypothetical protein